MMQIGILCIDKPEGFTSFDVVAKMRGISGCKKIGHGGTLDPMATGVLPLFFGKATAAIDRADFSVKEYLAEFELGIQTDTLDITGKVLCRQECAHIAPEAVIKTALSFLGDSMQLPPMYSARKVGGKRLYDLARQGIQVKREKTPIHIYQINCSYTGVNQRYRLKVRCSKGTYIRSLIADIGTALGCGAVMCSLRRTMCGGFGIQDCITLNQVQQQKDCLNKYLKPVDTVFASLPQIALNARLSRLFIHGVQLRADQVPAAAPGQRTRVYNNQEQFLGIAQLNQDKFVLDKFFYQNGE